MVTTSTSRDSATRTNFGGPTLGSKFLFFESENQCEVVEQMRKRRHRGDMISTEGPTPEATKARTLTKTATLTTTANNQQYTSVKCKKVDARVKEWNVWTNQNGMSTMHFMCTRRTGVQLS